LFCLKIANFVLFISHLFYLEIMRKIYFLIFLSLSSCVGLDKVQTTKSVSLEKIVAEAESSELFKDGDYPQSDWWQDFEDDHLSCLILGAYANNPGLEGVQKRVEEANQNALEVRSALFPSASALFQYGWLIFKDTHFIQNLFPVMQSSNNIFDFVFDFDYEFDIWGKNMKKYKSALGSAQAIRLSYEEAKLILSTTIAKSYFNLVAMKAKKSVLEQMLVKKQKYLSLVELRKKHRIDSKIDEHTFMANVKGVEETLTMIGAEIRLEESLINILCGRNPETKVETIALHKAFEKDLTLPKNITSTLLTQRPDLLSALWTTKKNALNVGVAVTNFLPVVTLMDAPLFLSAQGQKLFNPDSFANLLLPEVSQPLFTGGRLLSAWRKNVATYESSVYEFNDLFLKAAKEVFDSVINFIKISEMETLQEEKVKLTKDNYDLEFLKFSHGISSMLPVLDYDETYLENKTLMIEKQRLKKLAYISFIKALGGGYKEKEGAIEELEK